MKPRQIQIGKRPVTPTPMNAGEIVRFSELTKALETWNADPSPQNFAVLVSGEAELVYLSLHRSDETVTREEILALDLEVLGDAMKAVSAISFGLDRAPDLSGAEN